MRNACRISVLNPEEKRPIERYRNRRNENGMDLKGISDPKSMSSGL